MSGPIVRTGTNPKFWKNWDNVFGDKAKTGAGKASGGTKKSAASAAAASPKKAVKKAAKKAAAKKKASGKK